MRLYGVRLRNRFSGRLRPDNSHRRQMCHWCKTLISLHLIICSPNLASPTVAATMAVIVGLVMGRVTGRVVEQAITHHY